MVVRVKDRLAFSSAFRALRHAFQSRSSPRTPSARRHHPAAVRQHVSLARGITRPFTLALSKFLHRTHRATTHLGWNDAERGFKRRGRGRVAGCRAFEARVLRLDQRRQRLVSEKQKFPRVYISAHTRAAQNHVAFVPGPVKKFDKRNPGTQQSVQRGMFGVREHLLAEVIPSDEHSLSTKLCSVSKNMPQRIENKNQCTKNNMYKEQSVQ